MVEGKTKVASRNPFKYSKVYKELSRICWLMKFVWQVRRQMQRLGENKCKKIGVRQKKEGAK